jgi:methyl-accepting chemotaxis protein
MKITVKMKLIGMAALGIALVAIVGVISYWGASRVDGAMDEITLNSTALRNHMTADMMHDALRSDVMAAFVAAVNSNPKDEQMIVADLEEHAQIFTQSLDENTRLDLDEEIKAGLADARPALEAYIQSARKITDGVFKDYSAAYEQLDAFKQDFDRLADEMESLSALIETSNMNSQEYGDKAVAMANQSILAISVLAIVIMLVVSRVLSLQIIRPLSSLMENVRKIANGDLTTSNRVTSRDEIGDLMAVMNDMSAKLAEMVGRVSEASVSVATGAREIAAGSINLSQRTEEQASSLEETASSMEELTSTVKQNADNARQASQLANAARESAEKGSDVVSRAMGAMGEINTSSKKVADIIGVIDEIAFQTNLLALNAAVEAARAGEQGRGFAVVAAEVRSLAQRSATSAKEIKDLIGDSVHKVNDGARLVDQSGKTLEEIVASVKKVTDIVAEIAAASQEQSAGIEQVNRAVMQMDEMTQQNAALVEQASAASRSMEEQANVMSGLMGEFKTNGPGGARQLQDSGRRAAPKPETAASHANTGADNKARKTINVRVPTLSRRNNEHSPAHDDGFSMPPVHVRVNGKVNGSSADEWQEF